MILPDPERTAAVGRKIRAFLADEDVRVILDGLDRDAYERFRAADTETKRIEAWAFSRALEDVKASLQGAIEAGDLAESENRDLQ